MWLPKFMQKALRPASNAGWFPLVSEPSAGAWQRNEPVVVETALSHSAVFACVNLIASDIAKLPLHITKRTGNYWTVAAHEYSRLIRKPNSYQTRFQFVQSWMASKLTYGNTYVLKVRDNRNRVIALHVLDPKKVRPLISEDGAVFYELRSSDIHGLKDVTVPAREIIHDRGLAPYHPLVGLTPLQASAQGTRLALEIQAQSAHLFHNSSVPGGILTSAGVMPEEKAKKAKEAWEKNFMGPNVGRIAILDNSATYTPLSSTAADSQLIEQLQYTALDVCRAFSVPAWKIGAGPAAPYTSAEATNLQYLADCLQSHIESLELCLDDGLELPEGTRTELDETALLRLDTQARTTTLAAAVNAGLKTINEARAEMNLAPVEGGDNILRQIQDVPLAGGSEE